MSTRTIPGTPSSSSWRLGDLPTPALLLDLDRLEANIKAMAEKCRRLGVRLRPHVKTHKCPEVGRLQLMAGAQGITVSTLHEARAFADARLEPSEGADQAAGVGAAFDDITWAFPFIPSRIDEAVELAKQVRLRVVIDSREAFEVLESSGQAFPVFLKIDTGYHRAGIDPSDEAGLALTVELAQALSNSPTLTFDGLLTHAGHSYHAVGPEALADVAEEERANLTHLADLLRGRGLNVPTTSVGSTPGMSAVRHLEGIDEARPGNYVFYDGMQVDLGACRVQDCAVTVLTSVVSQGAGHSIVDAGALAMSKDTGSTKLNEASASDAKPTSYGMVFDHYEDGRLDPDRNLFAVSQEHGWLQGRHPIGQKLRLLPRHSCLTAALFDRYHLVRGEEVVGSWKIRRGR